MKAHTKILFVMAIFFSGVATATQWPDNAKSAASISDDDGWSTQQIQANILEGDEAQGAFQWPDNAKSAVSISADDGWPTQLTQASILETYGFRGTFYLTVLGMPSVVTNVALWKQVFQRGHEIGNHSYSHWSDKILAGKAWPAVASDVGNMEWWLLSNIFSMVSTDHTYAYPQGTYIIGSQATFQSQQVGACEYAALLSAVLTGARVGGSGENSPNIVTKRRFYISGIPIYGNDVTAFNTAKLAIDNGIAKGTWTVLIFHSLGDSGDGYSVSQSAYAQIINYLYARRMELWVAPVATVKNYIMANTPNSDWTCTLP